MPMMLIHTYRYQDIPENFWQIAPNDVEERVERYALRLLRREHPSVTDELAEVLRDNMFVTIGESIDDYLKGVADSLLGDFERWVKSHTRHTYQGIEYKADRYSNDYWAVREEQWETIKDCFDKELYIEGVRHNDGLFYQFNLFADMPVTIVLPLWDKLYHQLELKQRKAQEKEDSNDTNHTDS
jgi:hypothetical protein